MNSQNRIESHWEIGIYIGIKFPDHFHDTIPEFFLKILHPNAFAISASRDEVKRCIDMLKILPDILEIIFYFRSTAHFHPDTRHLAEIYIIIAKAKISVLNS